MQNAYPDYYPLFRCIADRCRHNCCIGWEIDVDGDSIAAYDQIGGEMGERLHKCIDRSGEMPHFILGEQERCPFLNGKNLCVCIQTKPAGERYEFRRGGRSYKLVHICQVDG